MKIDGTSVTLSRQKNELYQFCIANSYAILYKSLFEKCYYQFARKITINLCAKISHFMRKATLSSILITPEYVLYPVAIEVAVDAESGQKELES